MYSICILLLFALKLKSFLMFADYYVLLLLVLATRRSDLHKMQSSVYHAQLNCDFSKLCVLLNYCKQQKLRKIKVLWSIQVSIFTVFSAFIESAQTIHKETFAIHQKSVKLFSSVAFVVYGIITFCIVIAICAKSTNSVHITLNWIFNKILF